MYVPVKSSNSFYIWRRSQTTMHARRAHDSRYRFENIFLRSLFGRFGSVVLYWMRCRTAYALVTTQTVALLKNDATRCTLYPPFTMEHQFSPCTRLHDILDSQGLLERVRRHDPEPLQELNLDVSTEELLSAETAFTFADLYAILKSDDTVVWLTPHAAVAHEFGLAMFAWNLRQDNGSCCVLFNVDGNEFSAMAHSLEHLYEIFDIVLRLLAVSVVQSIHLCDMAPDLVINALTLEYLLEYLMEQCQSLKVLSLSSLYMNENHIRVLGDHSRPDLEIELIDCKLTSTGAIALAGVLGRNQGPTKLHDCKIDSSVLADGLCGNSSLKSLTPRNYSSNEDGNRDFLPVAGALGENKGLVDLDFHYGFVMNDDTWGAICDSLKAHPTLEVLDLRCESWRIAGAAPPPAVPTSRIQVLLDMMKVNTSIHTIRLHDQNQQQELFRESVIPYLETNRLRPRLLAIQQAHPIPYRAKVLGRALLAVRTDANRFWMLLSENPEVAFQSGTTTIAAAANLPAPGTATT
jgi:hypothetical protein